MKKLLVGGFGLSWLSGAESNHGLGCSALVGDKVISDQNTFGVKNADLYSDLLKYQTKLHTNGRYCSGHYQNSQ